MLPDLAVTAPARTPSDHRHQGTSMPTRRELAADIRSEHASLGIPISASKANRLAVRLLEHGKALEEVAATESSCLTYRDHTGETAVFNVLAGGGSA